MSGNLFLELSEQQMSAPVKARLRAADKGRSEREQKRDADQEKLSAHYRALRQKELADARGGPDGAKIDALIAPLDNLTIETIPDLARFVRAQGWHTAAAHTLFMVRRLAAESVMRLREKRGLPPFDDSLPGESASPEEQLRSAFAEIETSTQGPDSHV